MGCHFLLQRYQLCWNKCTFSKHMLQQNCLYLTDNHSFLVYSDWTKRIEYQPGSGSVPLFPSIHLETCDGAVSSIQITTELQTNYIGKGCDRETYSEKSLQKLCGRLPCSGYFLIHCFKQYIQNVSYCIMKESAPPHCTGTCNPWMNIKFTYYG